LICGGVLAILVSIAIPTFITSKISANEGAAASILKTYNGMMKTFKESNYQARNKSYPQGYGPETNSGKYCALYYEINSAGEFVALIDQAAAHADCRADGDTDAIEEEGCYMRYTSDAHALVPVSFQMKPKAGYWYGLMMYCHDGEKSIPYDNTYSKDHYALVAFPSDYGSTGQTTFIINEEGTVYSKDRGKSGYLDTYPGPDPVKHGWEVAQ